MKRVIAGLTKTPGDPVKTVIDALMQALGPEAPGIVAEPLARSGEALATLRLTAAGDPARAWVAKRLHPALRREAAAYRGPLAALDLAPRLIAHVADDEGFRWIVMEDAGSPLAGLDPAAWLADVASLAARIHEVSPNRLHAPRWRRRAHVRHGFRHLRGEWRIAVARVESGVRAGVLENDVAPTDAEARRVLEEAWRAMAATGPGLVHGDFQLANILRADAGPTRAVDWSQWGEGSPLVDLVSIAMDLSEEDRDRFLDLYLARRGLETDRVAWGERLGRALPLRQLFGVGVLAHYAVEGSRPKTVAASLPRRLEGWSSMRKTSWR